MGVYGPHTKVKCLLKALIFGTCKKNITYSQMRFQLYQSHSLILFSKTLVFQKTDFSNFAQKNMKTAKFKDPREKGLDFPF